MKQFYCLLTAFLILTSGNIWAQAQEPKGIDEVTLTPIAEQIYTGDPITPDVTLTDGAYQLVQNTDYTLQYQTNTSVGTATVTITGAGNYTGSRTTTFDIAAKAIDAADVTVSTIANQPYTGTAITPQVTVSYNGKELIEGTDYTIAFTDNTNVGSASYTITGTTNFTGTRTGSFDITAASIADATMENIADQTYTGSAITPTVTLSLNGTDLVEGTDYQLAITNNTEVGTATVTATGIGNYTGTLTGSFNIVGESLETATIAAIPEQTYTGEAFTPAVQVTLNGTTLTEGTDFEVAYADNTNAGEATVTITGKGNYSGTATANFTINPRDISQVNIATITPTEYTGEEVRPVPVVTDGTRTLAEGTDFTTTYANNTAVGTPTLTITGQNNYTGTKEESFTITPKDISSLTITPIPNQVATGSALTPAVEIKNGDVTLTPETDFTATYSNNTEVGTATVNITGTGNYTGTTSTTFNIAQYDISVATISPVEDQIYTGSAITPSVEVTVAAETLTAGTDYEVLYSDNINAGTATITVNGKGEYGGTITSTFTITPATLTDAMVSSIADQTYTGSAIEPDVTVTFNGNTLVKDTDYQVTYSNNTARGNAATATITGINNFEGTVTKTFNIVEGSENPNPGPTPGDNFEYTYNNIDVTIGEGIISSFQTMTYILKDGERMNIYFRLEDNMHTNNVRVLLDGEIAPFDTVPGSNQLRFSLYHDYKDHTISIGLGNYRLYIPEVEGVTTNPPAGFHSIALNDNINFSVTLATEYDQSDIKVYANDVLLEKTATRATTYNYTINNVQGPIRIRIEGVQKNGIDPTGNAELDETAKVYATYGTLFIETAKPAMAYVYTVTGQQKAQGMVSGRMEYSLPSGIYIVRIDNTVYKVAVK